MNTAPAPALAAAGPAGPPVAAGHGPGTLPTAEAPPAPAEPVVRIQASPLRLADLGTPDQVYPASTWRQMACWLCSLVCFGIAGLVGYGVLNQPHKSPNSGLALMGMFALGGFASCYFAVKLGELSYLVFRDALVEKRGKESRIIPWDKIREVYQTIHPAWKKYQIVTRQGFDIELTGNVKNYLALGDQVEEKVVEILLPAALASLEQGTTLRFGPLSVSRAALQFDGDSFGWQQVSLGVGLNREPMKWNTYSNLIHLHIYSPVRTKALKVEIGKIPNYRLFMELVRRNWPQCLPPEV